MDHMQLASHPLDSLDLNYIALYNQANVRKENDENFSEEFWPPLFIINQMSEGANSHLSAGMSSHLV